MRWPSMSYSRWTRSTWTPPGRIRCLTHTVIYWLFPLSSSSAKRRHLPPLTSHRRTQVVHLGTAAAAELADNHLQVVNGSADDQQHNQIGYEKGAAAVLQGGERESPHVAQANGHGDARHQELDVVAPVAALRHRGRGCHCLRRRKGFGDLGAVLFWFSGWLRKVVLKHSKIYLLIVII